MNYITHTVGGVAFGMAAFSFLFQNIAPTEASISGTLIAGAALGSLLPDIDHGKSYISHKAPLIGFIVAALFKHRGVLHTPIINFGFTIALLILTKMFCPVEYINYAYYAVLGIGIGYLSHILLDTCNVQGIMWLFPISNKRFHILGITTGSIAEKIFAAAMIAIIVWRFPPEYIEFAQKYLK